jgi:hypothetical protein
LKWHPILLSYTRRKTDKPKGYSVTVGGAEEIGNEVEPVRYSCMMKAFREEVLL